MLGRRKAILTLSILLCLGFTLQGEEKTFSMLKEHFSLKDLIKSAKQDNPNFKAARESFKQSFQNDQNTQRLFWPSVSLNASATHARVEHSNSPSSLYGLGINQPIYQGGALRSRQKLSDLDLERAHWQLLREEQRLVLQVSNAYYDQLLFKAQLQEEKDALERLNKHAKNVRSFFKEAKVWKNDVLQADVRVARGKKSLVSARHDLLTGRAILNQLRGHSIDHAIFVSGNLTWEPIELSWKTVKTEALNQHPDLEMSRIQALQAKENIKVVRSEQIPTLSLQGNYQISNNYNSSSSYSNNASIALSGSWTVWQGQRMKFKKAAAKHGLKASYHRFEARKQQILLGAKQAWFELKEAEEQIKVLQKALKHAEENYRVNQVRYQEQMGTGNDLLDAEDLLRDTRLDWLRAIRDYWKALMRLQFEVAAPLKKKRERLIHIHLKKR